MELKAQFEKVVKQVQEGEKKEIENSVKLEFYGLYKQATVGDVNCEAPWGFQIVQRAKWDAWNAVKGMSKDDAMLKYIELFEKHNA